MVYLVRFDFRRIHHLHDTPKQYDRGAMILVVVDDQVRG